MTIRLVLLDPVPRCFYPEGSAEPSVDMITYPLLRDPGQLDSEVNWRGGGVTPTLTVALDNHNGELTAMFADPPLRGRLENDQRTIFEGEIDAIDLTERDVRIGLVA